MGTVAPCGSSPRSTTADSPRRETLPESICESGLSCASLYVRPYDGQLTPSFSRPIPAPGSSALAAAVSAKANVAAVTRERVAIDCRIGNISQGEDDARQPYA